MLFAAARKALLWCEGHPHHRSGIPGRSRKQHKPYNYVSKGEDGILESPALVQYLFPLKKRNYWADYCKQLLQGMPRW